jgi:hypothetical protein
MCACGGISNARSSRCPQRQTPSPARHLVDAELRAMRVAGHVDQQMTQRAIDEPRDGGARKAPASAAIEGDFEP